MEGRGQKSQKECERRKQRERSGKQVEKWGCSKGGRTEEAEEAECV